MLWRRPLEARIGIASARPRVRDLRRHVSDEDARRRGGQIHALPEALGEEPRVFQVRRRVRRPVPACGRRDSLRIPPRRAPARSPREHAAAAPRDYRTSSSRQRRVTTARDRRGRPPREHGAASPRDRRARSSRWRRRSPHEFIKAPPRRPVASSSLMKSDCAAGRAHRPRY